MSLSTVQGSRQTIVARRFKHITAPIIPLLSTTTMCAHPSFPRSLLAYHLLSSAELDALAVYYHQSSPKSESWTYPAPVASRWRFKYSPPSSQYLHNPHLRRRYHRRQAAARIWKNIFIETTANNNTTTTQLSPLNTTAKNENPPASPKIEPTDCGNDDDDTAIITEDKRRRFGRFIGLQGCESPGMTPEQMEQDTREAVYLWFEEEIERRMARDRMAEEARRKGAW